MANIYVNNAWVDQAAFEADTTKSADAVWGTTAFSNLTDAVKAASSTEANTITVASGTYDDSIVFRASVIGEQKGDIKFVAAEGADVTFSGTLQLGLYEKGVGVEKWESAVEFSGITFDHADAATHSILVYSVDGFALNDCTIIGDGEYGIGSTGGNNTTPGSTITDCTFENAGIQVSGNFGTDLEISDCTFNDSCVNIQGGNGVNFSGNTFNATLTDASIGNSFYCIRSNDIAVNIEDCVFNIDSTLTEDAGEQAKWGVLHQRKNGATKWNASDIEVNFTDAALLQGDLFFSKNENTAAANDRITVNGITSTSNDVDAIIGKSEGSLNVVNEGTYSIYDDGVLVNSATASTVYVNSTYAAGADLGEGKIFGFNAFADFASAMAAARDNDLVSRIEIEGDITTNSNVDTDNYYDIAQKLTIGAASGGKYTVSAGSLAILVQGNGASLTIEDGVTIENLDVVADGFATSNEEMIINGEMKALSLKVWTNNNGITVNETGKVALGYGDGQLDLAYGNGYLTVNGTLENTKEESLTDGPQFKAGYSGTRGTGNTINLNDTYFEGGAWFKVAGSNGTFNLDNSVMKIGGGDSAGSLTVSSSGNVFNVNNGSRLVVANLTLGANNTISVADSSLEVATNLTNNGAVNFTGTGYVKANVSGSGWIYMDSAVLDEDTNIKGGKVRFTNGTSTLDGVTIDATAFQVGIGAYNAKDERETVADVVVNVTNNSYINSPDSDYNGWIGTGYYDTDADKAAAMTDARYILNVENSVVRYGYLHVSNDGVLNVTGNADEKVSYAGVEYSFWGGRFILNGVATFDSTDAFVQFTNVSADNGSDEPGKLIVQNGAKYVSWMDSSTDIVTFQINNKGIVEVDDALIDARHGTVIAADASLEVKNNGTFKGKIITNNGTITVNGGNLIATSTISNAGTITVDVASTLTAGTLTGEGTITIDATGFTGVKTIIDLSGTESLEGKVTIDNLADGVSVIYGKDGDVALSNVKTDILYVDAAFTGDLGKDLGDGKYAGINAFATVSEALAAANADTQEIRVSSNITEELSGKTLSGSIVKDGETDVTVTDSKNDDYVTLNNASIGDGVTVDAKYIFLQGTNTIDGNVKSDETGSQFWHGYGAQTTINGSVETYNTFNRFGSDISIIGTAEAGKGKEAEFQYKATGYLATYSGVVTVKDSAAQVAYVNLGTTVDSGYSPAKIVLDNALLKTTSGPNGQVGQMYVQNGASVEVKNDSVLDLTGTNGFGYLSMHEGTSLSLTDSALLLGKEGNGSNVLDGSVELVNSTITTVGTINNGGSITIDATSLITAKNITGTGSIVIDATELDGIAKVIDLNAAASLEGKVTILGDGVTAIYGADGDVTITNASTKTVYYDAAWAGKTAGEDLGDGKVFGVNAFSEFVDNGVKGSWSNLLILPEDTTEIVLAAGNADDAEYGKLRPTQDLVVKTSGEGYAVVDRIVNMGVDLVIDEDAKVKVLTLTGLSGANNQGGALIVNGELYFANANSSNKAIYLWGMNSTPGQLVINAGGLLKADAGNIENHGTVTVLGTMELGKAGDAPKLAGVGTPGNGGWDGHLIVDGKDGEGILNVKHNQINFGGGNTSVDWIDAPNECSVDIINGGKITTAAVTFRNGKNNVLNITDGTFEFTDDADYANLTPRYFDNQGEILVGQDGVVDMNNRTFTNDGYIKLSSNASMSATKFVNNNVVELNDFNGTLAGMVKGEGENASGSIKATGDTTIADTIDASMISVGSWDEFAEGVAANDKLTIAEAGKVSVANAYVQPGGELDIDGELNVTGGYNGVDGIFANYGKVNVDGKLNITTDASCGENLIGNLELDNSEISLTVAEGGELNINTTEGQSKNTLNVVNGAKLDVDGTFNADANTVINNTGVIEVGGEFTSEGTVNLGAYLIFDGLTAGDARELTVALTPAGATEGLIRTVTVAAGETGVKFYTNDLADGTYNLTIVDGTDVLVTETTVTNGTIDVADGKISLNGVSVGNGSFNVTGASSVSVANLNGTLNIADAQLTESNINKGSVIFEGDNTYSGDFNASYAFVGDWYGESFDGSVDFGTDSNVSVGGQMIIGYDSLVAGANTVTFGDADGEATDKVFYSADVSVRRDSVLTIANTTGNNQINTMNVMGKVILDNAKLSGEVQIGYKNDDMGVEAEVIVQNGAEYTIGGSSNSVVVIGKSSGGKLTVNDATVTVSRCGYGSSYTDLPQDKLVIGYNGAAGVVTVENNANFNALYSVLVNEGSSITVDDSNFSVGVTLYNYGSVTVSGNSTVKANVVGDITVTDGTVFSADTALTVDGMINASGTVTATWNTVSGSLTADTIVLTGVELPTDADIVVYSGKADIKTLVINGSTCADNSIVINNELYDVEITDSAIVLSTSDSDYTPISGEITSVTQTAGTYTFTVAADITGGSGAEDYTYSYTVTDSTGKEFNAVANGLEFTLTDVPAAGKLNVSMTVTDAYGAATKYTTDAFAADVADYTAPKIDMLTSVAGKDINVSWIATDETGVAGYEIECNGQVYNLKFPVTGEAVGFDFLDLDEGKYSITVSAYDKAGNRVSSETSTINLQVGAKLLDNGVSQIVAWDAGRGAAGYIATDVDGSAKWVSVGYGMADIWDVVATGKFAGSTVDNDGLLLYNKVNNTFAAWTDLSNATHGYKSLCWVESDFSTKCTANLDGDGFDDVLIYNTEGSFGAVLGAATYKDIWHVSDAPPTVELIGAGTFGHEDGLDSLVVKNLTDGSYEMWHNTNINGKKWGWGKVTITPAVEGWEVAAIGDFSGDGIDDIAMWNSNDGEVVLLENGKNDEQTVIGTLNDSKWEISAVGDYNGDGKEDLLLRELTSGYGGLYFANGGDLSSITSLGSSIATDVKDNKFAIIA